VPNEGSGDIAQVISSRMRDLVQDAIVVGTGENPEDETRAAARTAMVNGKFDGCAKTNMVRWTFADGGMWCNLAMSSATLRIQRQEQLDVIVT
jgi:hypothetical protein